MELWGFEGRNEMVGEGFGMLEIKDPILIKQGDGPATRPSFEGGTVTLKGVYDAQPDDAKKVIQDLIEQGKIQKGKADAEVTWDDMWKDGNGAEVKSERTVKVSVKDDGSFVFLSDSAGIEKSPSDAKPSDKKPEAGPGETPPPGSITMTPDGKGGYVVSQNGQTPPTLRQTIQNGTGIMSDTFGFLTAANATKIAGQTLFGMNNGPVGLGYNGPGGNTSVGISPYGQFANINSAGGGYGVPLMGPAYGAPFMNPAYGSPGLIGNAGFGSGNMLINSSFGFGMGNVNIDDKRKLLQAYLDELISAIMQGNPEMILEALGVLNLMAKTTLIHASLLMTQVLQKYDADARAITDRIGALAGDKSGGDVQAKLMAANAEQGCRSGN
ncbi:MAG: hypothetical protein HY073_05455 [Deltaproteobacteria bacterium]|nr:hypothetical protein [Deltaproteobacteria bacterium]